MNDELQMTNGMPTGKAAGSFHTLPFGSFDIRNSAFEIPPVHHLAPQTALRASAFARREAIPQVVSEAKDNMAGFVLANGSMSSNQSGEGDIRRAGRKFCPGRTSLFSAN